MKTTVNSLKISSFSKIPTLKLFVISEATPSVQFLVIISCFTFPLLHSKKRRSQMFLKIVALKNFGNFTGNHL